MKQTFSITKRKTYFVVSVLSTPNKGVVAEGSSTALVYVVNGIEYAHNRFIYSC